MQLREHPPRRQMVAAVSTAFGNSDSGMLAVASPPAPAALVAQQQQRGAAIVWAYTEVRAGSPPRNLAAASPTSYIASHAGFVLALCLLIFVVSAVGIYAAYAALRRSPSLITPSPMQTPDEAAFTATPSHVCLPSSVWLAR